MAQKFSGMTEPFSGVMFSETTFSSPELELSVYVNKPIIEPELCFEISEDLVDINTPYDEKNIISYIKSICPVIEIVNNGHYGNWPHSHSIRMAIGKRFLEVRVSRGLHSIGQDSDGSISPRIAQRPDKEAAALSLM